MWRPWLERRAVTVDRALANQLLSEARRWAPLETGGILLGEFVDSDRGARVTEVVGAGPGARRETNRFVPDGPWQRRQIAERYLASGRNLEYIGDWHSHPAGNGPSKLDRETARRIAREKLARCPHPVLLIVTRVALQWELRAYRFGHKRLRRVRLGEY